MPVSGFLKQIDKKLSRCCSSDLQAVFVGVEFRLSLPPSLWTQGLVWPVTSVGLSGACDTTLGSGRSGVRTRVGTHCFALQ